MRSLSTLLLALSLLLALIASGCTGEPSSFKDRKPAEGGADPSGVSTEFGGARPGKAGEPSAKGQSEGTEGEGGAEKEGSSPE